MIILCLDLGVWFIILLLDLLYHYLPNYISPHPGTLSETVNFQLGIELCSSAQQKKQNKKKTLQMDLYLIVESAFVTEMCNAHKLNSIFRKIEGYFLFRELLNLEKREVVQFRLKQEDRRIAREWENEIFEADCHVNKKSSSVGMSKYV